MKPKIVLVVGVPASGKTWVATQAGTRFTYVPHDEHEEREYPGILAASLEGGKPVVGEIPFGLSKIQGELEGRGIRVVPVFVFESEPVLRARWKERGLAKDSAIRGHLTRQETYRQRAHELGSFIGTSAQVLEHLKKLEL